MGSKERIIASSAVVYYDDLNKHQKKASKIVKEWNTKKEQKKKPIFRLGGGPGAGKSFLLRYLINELELTPENCMVMAYTGQAVNVLRLSGIQANTIHSSIMIPSEVPVRDKAGEPIIKHGIPVTMTRYTPLKYIPSSIKLIIIDEASFMDKSLEDIVARYGVPILEVGDCEQLPPVAGKPSFHENNIDHFMPGCMRQADGSKLAKFITDLRSMDVKMPFAYMGGVSVLKGQPTIEESFYKHFTFINNADVVITSTNKQRQILTDLYRKHVIKTTSPYPIKGEKLICRRNNAAVRAGDFPLANGTQGIAMHTVSRGLVDSSAEIYTLDFKPIFLKDEFYEELVCDAKFMTMPFGSEKADKRKYHPGIKLEYAHTITAHLSQGAQYNKVVFFDSYNSDDEYRHKIQYTASSRAVEHLTFITAYRGY